MKTLYNTKKTAYDGSQLRSHWAFDTFKIIGNSIIAFSGPCRVENDHMVDLVDVRDKKFIKSESMLHFIGEEFHLDLEKMIHRQRMLISIIFEELVKRTRITSIKRSGNDIYDGKAKLTVAIATLSPVSSLLHVGINISSKNTPVETKGLLDYKISPQQFAKSVLKKFAGELKEIEIARSKVRGVD